MADSKLTNDASSNGFNSKQNPSIDKSGQRFQDAKAAQAKYVASQNACITQPQYTRKPGARGIPQPKPKGK